MTKAVLLIYAVNKNTGLSGKVKKIHDGFIAAGCSLEKIYVDVETGFFEKIKNVFLASFSLLRVLTLKQFDTIYVRYLYYFFPLFLILLVLKRPYQIEINNNIAASFASSDQVFRAWLDSKIAGMVINNARCVHVVTHELVELYRGLYPKAHISYTPNFVVDEQYQPGEREIGTTERINLVFMGDTEQDWHGMPLFVESVVANNPWFAANCCLHIVGRCSPKMDALIAHYNLAGTVIAHGFLSGKDKHDIINQMDIGMGCFNLPLIGLKEATAIKNGEYLYSGLHLILGAPDSRLSAELPFVCYVDLLENREQAAEQIRQFIQLFRRRSSRRSEAHDYARAHLLVDNYVRNIIAEQTD